jgi:hypothetical protein
MARHGLHSWKLWRKYTCISASLDDFLHPVFHSFSFSLSRAVVGLISPLLCQALVRHSRRGSREKERPPREGRRERQV